MAGSGKKFAYYRRLSARQKRIYDKSDAITDVGLPQASRFGLCVRDLAKWLVSENKVEVQRAAQRLAKEVTSKSGGVPMLLMS